MVLASNYIQVLVYTSGYVVGSSPATGIIWNWDPAFTPVSQRRLIHSSTPSWRGASAEARVLRRVCRHRPIRILPSKARTTPARFVVESVWSSPSAYSRRRNEKDVSGRVERAPSSSRTPHRGGAKAFNASRASNARVGARIGSSHPSRRDLDGHERSRWASGHLTCNTSRCRQSGSVRV